MREREGIPADDVGRQRRADIVHVPRRYAGAKEKVSLL